MYCSAQREARTAGKLSDEVDPTGRFTAAMTDQSASRSEPPGSRFRVGHCALTKAEYFRDDEHRDVVLLIDNIFRFSQAGSEVSGLMGQMPSRLGYQPTMGTELSALEERIANTASGAITSIQAVYVPADDFTNPAAVHTFSHLSASVVLSRQRASEGLFPAIDPLQSSSKIATPGIVGERHYSLAQEIRRTLAQYAGLKDLIAMLGLEQLSSDDRQVVARARRLRKENSGRDCRQENSLGGRRTGGATPQRCGHDAFGAVHGSKLRGSHHAARGPDSDRDRGAPSKGREFAALRVS